MEFSGKTTAYEHKHGDAWKDNKDAGEECLKTVKFLDVQWSNCPEEVEEIVKHLWRYHELGNDNYFFRCKPSHYLNGDCTFEGEEFKWGTTQAEQLGWVEVQVDPRLLGEFLLSKGVGMDEEVIVHWWW